MNRGVALRDQEFSLEIELRPCDPAALERAREFHETLAQARRARIVCGPVAIASEPDVLSSFYAPVARDWSMYAWWAGERADAFALERPDVSLSWIPEHGILAIELAGQAVEDIESALAFIERFWHPDGSGMRYAHAAPGEHKVWRDARLRSS